MSSMLCPNCQFDNPSVMKFCGGCGQSLSAAPAADERRHLTVMFCDLVDSTVMSERLDPEVMLDVIQRCQEAARLVIERYEGHIAQYLGDGILVYFGYPKAHEDDAGRAARASLEILEKISGLSDEFFAEIGMPLQMRIGLHTGIAVTGAIGGGDRVEHLATGSVPNMAARVQSKAQPGECLVTADLQALLDDRVGCEFSSTEQLKGIAEPVDLYRLTGIVDAPARAGTERSVFIGRTEELRVLRDALFAARQGEGRVVMVSGEAGMGKSRLCRELFAQVSDPRSILVYRCAAYHQNTPFIPLLEALPRHLGLMAEPNDDGFVDELADCLAANGVDDSGSVELLAEFLSVGKVQLGNVAPSIKRRETRMLLADLLLRMAERQHKLLVLEDLHWADPSTLEVVEQLVANVHGRSVVVIGSHRPNFEQPWLESEKITSLRLAPLPIEVAQDFIERNKHRMSEDVLRQVVERADGVPLYLEELSRAVQVSTEDGQTDAHVVPNSLRDSLTARLDSLGNHKEVVQIGALIGRRFSMDLLRGICDRQQADIEEGIQRATEAELIFAVEMAPPGTFAFRHALIQETAYDSLLRQNRRRLHGAVADQIQAGSAQRPNLYALHLDRAERFEEAAHAYYRAGKHSSRRSAYLEAEHAYERALTLLGNVPERQDILDLRFALLLGNTQLLTILYSYTDNKLSETFEEARGMLESGSVSADPFEFYVGYWSLKAVRCEVEAAQAASQVLQGLVPDPAHPRRERVAIFTHGCNAFYLGQITEAHETLGLVVPKELEPHPAVVGDVLFIANLVLAWTDALYGDIDRCKALLDCALESARISEDPFMLVQTLCYACTVHEDIASPLQRINEFAGEALELAERYGFKEWLGYARMHRNYVAACQGDLEALVDLEAVVEELYDGNSDNSWAHSLFTLAEAQGKCGKLQVALVTIERAIEVCEQRVGRYIEPECHRLRGEVLLVLGREREGRESLLRALVLARRDGVHYLGMRALCSLIDHMPSGEKDAYRDELEQYLEERISGETPHTLAARARVRQPEENVRIGSET